MASTVARVEFTKRTSGQRQLAELPARIDAQFAEDAAQVGVNRARAEKELRSNFAGGGTGGHLPGDVQLVGGQGIGRLDTPLPGVLTGGPQFAGGTVGECLRAHVQQ